MLGIYCSEVPFAVDPLSLQFYVSFAAWRSACIGAAVIARYARGEEAGAPIDSTLAESYVGHYLDRCFQCYEAYTHGVPFAAPTTDEPHCTPGCSDGGK
jgi:hypothetical protein